MRVDSWALTDVGRARKHNEDGWLIDDQLGLYAVADGMGGHAAGEVASAYGLRCVQEQLVKKKPLLDDFAKNPTPEKRAQVSRELELAVNVASSDIYHMAQRDKKRHGMGTTLSTLLLVGNKAFMAHVGDSRIYLARAGQIHQLSEDHSYLWEQIKKGAITVEEAKRSPFSNVITRAVGITETVQVDTLVFDILPGDTYLACSDGMHGYIESEAELAQILSSEDGEKIPKRLVGLANARGGKDNITCVVLRVPGDAGDPSAVDVIEKLDTLRRIPLFRHLNYKELVKVLNQTQQRTFEDGEVVIEEQSDGDEFYIILSGEVEVSKGGRPLTVLGPSVHFGEMALVDRSPRSATVRARNKTRLMSLSRKAFYHLVRTEPVLSSKLLWSFVQVLSHRLRATNEALKDARSEASALPPFAELDNLREQASRLGTSEVVEAASADLAGEDL
ncbi:MAG: cyclic nucleotide-binding domain-containing protein [Myxococcales bacterium]|nr:cyclic nucleotide-binding domain-containing protein [Myxococcales bacterium]MCB9646319.1 cyclic nucleotide-binding domain-containing protein [Deltaproteobacteria bacterium]